MSPHRHEKNVEVIYFLKGNGTIQVGDERANVEPGTAVFVPSGMEHITTNNSSEDMQFVYMFSPPITNADLLKLRGK